MGTTLNGDGPCGDCGTTENIIWFTDNVFWNAVCLDVIPILCIRCFVQRVEATGYKPSAWRLIPSWPWAGEISPDHEQKQLERHERWLQGKED